MGSEALLQRACELAFAVARDDAEGNPPVDPPGDMRSFLYLTRLPRRAISVAQQAIENDSEFRARVASRAAEEDVGRAGFIWLHRPAGWAPEFDALSRAADEDVTVDGLQAPQSLPAPEPEPDPAFLQSATISPIRGLADETTGSFEPNLLGTDDGIAHEPDFPDFTASMNDLHVDMGAEEVAVQSPTGDSEADAIESELSSLRGLVDRLAGERENVLAAGNGVSMSADSVAELEDELATLTSEHESLRHEFSLVSDELRSSRGDRDEARRLHSEALQRQVELERELSELREALAETENRSSDFQASLLTIEDKFTRLKGESDELHRERNVTQSQLDTMTTERNQIREDRMSIKAERDDLAARLADVNEKTGGVDVEELTESNRSLTSELDATSRELARMIAQVETLEQQLHETTSTADELKAERSEMSSRLADAELALSTTQTQHDALKGDSETMAVELGTLRAERDGLQSQLGELQSSLSEVLDEQAEARHKNDADRKSLNELRVERDVLQARVNDIEQTHKSYENRIGALVKERDDLLTSRDDLVTERGQLRGEAAAAATAREQLVDKIESLEAKLAPLETELQAERRQREELANRLLQLDEIAATNNAATELLGKERDDLLSAVTELREERDSLREVKRERDQLKGRAERAEQRADRAESQLEAETEKRTAATTELSGKLTDLESSKQSMETLLADNDSELLKLRADVEELNRENTKLRFNLQVAESSVVEASDTAERARQESVEARAKIAELEASVAAVGRFTDSGAMPAIEEEELAPQLSLTDFVTDGEDELPPIELDEPNEAAEALAELDVQEPPAPPVAPVVEESLQSDGPWVDGSVDFVADSAPPPTVEADEFVSLTPLAEAPSEQTGETPEVVSLDDRRVDEYSGEYGDDTWVAGEADPAIEQERDELDEIGDLISQAAASFEHEGSNGIGEPAAAAGFAAATNAAPPSLLDGADVPPSDFEIFEGAESVSGRKNIDIPQNIVDDELAVARHIVSSPDIVLLVDGDSVASMGWPSLSVAEQRDALVTYLADLSSSSGAAPDVVFDGRVGEDDSLPASQRAVRIRLSTPPVDPAAALEELLDAYPAQWPLALVTDDDVLASVAGERGASVLNNGQLLDLFLA